MAERPIIFNDAMVRATLDGRKTQTRRPVKVPKSWEHWYPENHWLVDETGTTHPGVMERYHLGPFGAPGDRLWVRECFAKGVDGCERGLSYRADHLDPRGDGPANPMRWTPSIHMPRWASRLTLEVESVRIERLHEIHEDDAKAEGLKAMTKDGSLFKWGIPDRDGWPGRDDDGWHWHEWRRDPREAFAHLWDSIYGTWSDNPLVWVATFKVEEVRRG